MFNEFMNDEDLVPPELYEFPDMDFPPSPETGFEEMQACAKCSHLRASVSIALSAMEELVIGKYVPRAQLSFFGDGKSVLSDMVLSFKDAHQRIVQASSLLCFECAREDALKRAAHFTGIERQAIDAGAFGLEMAEREMFAQHAWANYYSLMNPFNEESGEFDE